MNRFHVILAIVVLIAFATTIGISAPLPPSNHQVSAPLEAIQNEESIWTCPSDSNIVVGIWRDFRLGYRQIAVGRSTDGGNVWWDSLVNMGVHDWQTDPVLNVDRLGNLYMCMMDVSTQTFPLPESLYSELAFLKSVDNGATWIKMAAPPGRTSLDWEDKPWFAIDRTGGPYDGNIYLGWSRFTSVVSGTGRIMLRRSTDGAASFSDTTVLASPFDFSSCGYEGLYNDAGQWTMPVVGSDGAVYIFWVGPALDTATCALSWHIRLRKSTDGGVTFDSTRDILRTYGNWEWIDGPLDAANILTGTADISGGPHDGNIYLAVASKDTSNTAYYDYNIETIRSTDAGQTWYGPSYINDDPTGQGAMYDQFHVQLFCNNEGTLISIFYDQRTDPISHFKFDVFAAYSFDGGETYTTNHRISDVSIDPNLLFAAHSRTTPPATPSVMAGRIAEYIGLTAFKDHVNAAWTDTRNGNEDVFGANWVIPLLEPRLYLPIEGFLTTDVEISFLWSTCWKEGLDSYRLEISTDSTFATIDHMASGLTDNAYTPPSPLPADRYFWRVKAFRTAGDSTEYSSVRSYTTGCAVAATPVLTAPTDGDSLDVTSVPLAWNAVGDAISYGLQLALTSDFASPLLDTSLADTVFTAGGLSDSTTYHWRVNASNPCGTGAWGEAYFTVFICPIANTGDVNVDGVLTSADIIYLVNYVFKGGPEPQPVPQSGDVNCDGSVTSSDIIYMVSHVFKGGPAPCNACSVYP